MVIELSGLISAGGSFRRFIFVSNLDQLSLVGIENRHSLIVAKQIEIRAGC